MTNKTTLLIIVIVAVLIIVALLIDGRLFSGETVADDRLTALAQCLTDSGVVMYGLDSCSHCQNEKNAFGEAFSLINYVECREETDKCLEEGINAVPVWKFADGKELIGEQGPSKLAVESGCAFDGVVLEN